MAQDAEITVTVDLSSFAYDSDSLNFPGRPPSAPPQYRSVPLEISSGMVTVAHEAAQWFQDNSFQMLGCPGRAETTSDEEVEDRVAGWQLGYEREYKRVTRGKELYDFTKLPLHIKRATVERWDDVFFSWLDAHPEVEFDWLEVRFYFKDRPDQFYRDDPTLTAKHQDAWYAQNAEDRANEADTTDGQVVTNSPPLPPFWGFF